MNDIFHFGYFCLVIALGGLDILESKHFSVDKVKKIFEYSMKGEEERNVIRDLPCCLLHYHDELVLQR